MLNKLTLKASSEREIVITRYFDAPRELVFDALTKPELLKRWLWGPSEHSLVICETDLRVGGSFRYVWRFADGAEMGMGGVYREIKRPERLAHVELFDEDWTGGEVLVNTTLIEKEVRTLLTMVIEYSSAQARDAVLKSPMEQGISMSYDRLNRLLAEIYSSK